MRHHAFSFVELLVVIAIVSVLAAILLPSLEQALEQSRRMVCLNNEKQLYLTISLYANDFNDRLPSNCNITTNSASATNLNWQSNGGSAVNSAAFRHWAQAYAGVPLYNSTRTAQLSLDAAQTQLAYFKHPDERGLLACPGGNLREATTGPQYYYGAVDYWFPGFGGTYSWYNSYSFTRFSCVGVSTGGVRKAMIQDQLWAANPGMWRDFVYTHLMGHAPNDPQGVNTIAGDGSGSWTDYAPDWNGSGDIQRFPPAYVTLRGWSNPDVPGNYNTITLVGSGGSRYYRSTTSAAQYEYWMREYYGSLRVK